uniref:Uncharacterized protein n=1 Tax=Arundo donax TaxID=35708 RepID=A0A0A9BRD3_ARUDO
MTLPLHIAYILRSRKSQTLLPETDLQFTA